MASGEWKHPLTEDNGHIYQAAFAAPLQIVTNTPLR